ncbi:MAG: methyltransferase domain-containing protein [Nitrospirae bacterium]|nr:methyltransferase domain-containing protein [Nitrospirota bacterium]
MDNDSRQQSLHEHLACWGLKRFTSDRDYFVWQRQQLSPADLNRLNAQVKRKREGDRCEEIAFYDLTAQPKILPVLCSQRYEYYEEIGLRVASRVGEAKAILDFGCGAGILTSFYARRYPEKEFVGVDRSPASIAIAEQKATELRLTNVRFDCVDIESAALPGSYDLILATHALVQAEKDPGIPSQSWETFGRGHGVRQQEAFEQRTGIGVRLNRLCEVLGQNGRMIVFEKTRQLARLVPFQRALASRGLSVVEQLESIRYQLVEEVADDGPFYVLQKGSATSIDWDESPEKDEGQPFNRAVLENKPNDPDAPLYENHWPSAQQAWEQLKARKVMKQTTRQEPDGRQLHVELGTSEGLTYLYCANTFDQRQLVIVDPSRTAMLETYYGEIISGSG